MADRPTIGRRALLRASAGTLAAAALAGCDQLSQAPASRGILERAEDLTHAAQRLLIGDALAPEYSEADISPDFRANGTIDPEDADYRALAANQFADWRLQVGGLVEKPLTLSLADLKAMPARTQITRHDCVEGWSSIGKWTGVPLAAVLDLAKPKPEARFVLLRCFDTMEKTVSGPVKYYETIALADARHPQTILAYAMNGAALPIPHGAPLRLRLERQLGYKMAKYIMAVELVEGFGSIAGGKGGYWEDNGYEWYAGI